MYHGYLEPPFVPPPPFFVAGATFPPPLPIDSVLGSKSLVKPPPGFAGGVNVDSFEGTLLGVGKKLPVGTGVGTGAVVGSGLPSNFRWIGPLGSPFESIGSSVGIGAGGGVTFDSTGAGASAFVAASRAF